MGMFTIGAGLTTAENIREIGSVAFRLVVVDDTVTVYLEVYLAINAPFRWNAESAPVSVIRVHGDVDVVTAFILVLWMVGVSLGQSGINVLGFLSVIQVEVITIDTGSGLIEFLC
jgi:hypothetical protein